MNLFVVFGFVAMIAATSWTVAGSPFQSSGVSTTTINGVTVKTTYNDGKAEYTINGKPATEQEARGVLGQGNNGIINSGNINIGRPMTPQEKQAFDKKMEDLRKKMENMGKGMGSVGMGLGMEQHRKMMEQHEKTMAEHHKKMANMRNEMANMGKGTVNTGPANIGQGMAGIGKGINWGGIGQVNTNTFEQHGNINQQDWNFG